MHAHHGVVGATGRERAEDRRRVRAEVADQVQDLVAEGDVEVAPTGRHRVGDLEPQRQLAAEPPGVSDRAGGGVVAGSVGDRRLSAQQAQEAAPVAAGVEDAAPGQVDVDRVEHRAPDELVLILHRRVLGLRLPVAVTVDRHAITPFSGSRIRVRLRGAHGSGARARIDINGSARSHHLERRRAGRGSVDGAPGPDARSAAREGRPAARYRGRPRRRRPAQRSRPARVR